MEAMTPEAWVRARLAEKRPLPKTDAEVLAQHAELQKSAKAACDDRADEAIQLLRLVRHGVVAEAELPE